jgi:hypothetical protein
VSEMSAAREDRGEKARKPSSKAITDKSAFTRLR